MDAIFNKIKSSVSEVLSGNPLSGEYDIQDQITGSAGPGLLWKIYRAQKKTTKEPASVFVFNKKQIDKLSKSDKNDLVSSIKRGVQQLTRLRHPKILSVMHPLEENRECLAFATEPVLTSLTDLISEQKNSAIPTSVLEEVEIKYGLLQVLEALAFLHGDVNLVHGNLHPNSVIISEKRMWKLSGFDFYVSSSSQQGQVQYDYTEWRADRHEALQPSLDYLAPECLLRCSCDPRSDMYSLGILIHAIYNQSKPVYQSHNSLSTCKQHVSEMKTFRQSILRSIPESLKEHMKLLLSFDPLTRPDAKSLLKIAHFDDVAVLTLLYLDSFFQRDNLQKSQYFKNLPNVLKQVPAALTLHRVLPVLFSECSNIEMIPFVLQNILVIAEQATAQDYNQLIFPKLVPIMKHKTPIQIPLLLLRSMTLLLSKTNERDTKIHILPMILSSIDVENVQLQELCLSILPSFSNLIDKEAMKSAVIPRIRHLCLTTENSSMKVKCLLCIAKMLNHMDKWFVLEEVLPFLNSVQSHEPAVLMTILGIYKTVFSHKDLGIPRETLAMRTLPYLIPLSVDLSLTKPQYQSFMAVITEMLSTLEKEQIAKLDEKGVAEDASKSLSLSVDNPTDDQTMIGFLREAGLSSGTNERSSEKAAAAANPVTYPKTSTTHTQVKDLTSTLANDRFQQQNTYLNTPHTALTPLTSLKPTVQNQPMQTGLPAQSSQSQTGSQSTLGQSSLGRPSLDAMLSINQTGQSGSLTQQDNLSLGHQPNQTTQGSQSSKSSIPTQFVKPMQSTASAKHSGTTDWSINVDTKAMSTTSNNQSGFSGWSLPPPPPGNTVNWNHPQTKPSLHQGNNMSAPNMCASAYTPMSSTSNSFSSGTSPMWPQSNLVNNPPVNQLTSNFATSQKTPQLSQKDLNDLLG